MTYEASNESQFIRITRYLAGRTIQPTAEVLFLFYATSITYSFGCIHVALTIIPRFCIQHFGPVLNTGGEDMNTVPFVTKVELAHQEESASPIVVFATLPSVVLFLLLFVVVVPVVGQLLLGFAQRRTGGGEARVVELLLADS